MDGRDVSMREEICDLFGMSRDLLAQQLDGFDDAALRTRHGEASAPLWILAHIVANRRNLVRIVTGEAEPAFPWEAAAAGGTGAADGLPDRASLVRLLEGRHNAFVAAMRATSDDALDEAPSGQPIWRRRLLLGAFMHESYHVGQLAHARRAAGLPPVTGDGRERSGR